VVSRSPTPIEIETQDTEASVLVIESQESDVIVIESQEDEPKLGRAFSPTLSAEPTGIECGCCFIETEIVSIPCSPARVQFTKFRDSLK
jgi:hypothetical protein